MIETKLLTAEEFAKLPSDGKKYELVKGILVEVCRPKYGHGYVQAIMAYYFNAYLMEHSIGVVTTESGYVTTENPDSVRGPDVAFMSKDRLGKQVPSDFVNLAPDLVVEIASDSDTVRDLQNKIDEYLAGGTRLIWVFYPWNRTVSVHRQGAMPVTIGVNDVLDGEDVLPGFRLPVNDVFKGL
jgi:Uma2 family endonuclease